jgi:uncharacterized protein (TIGR03435 family)
MPRKLKPALIFAIALAGYAQPGAAPQFEVATVKTSPPPSGDLININLGTLRNNSLTFANASLSDCLRFAYGIVSDDQLAGPDWIKSKEVRFDIIAKTPPDTTREQAQLMLQRLLADRLKVRVHHEPRELPHLALVVGKKGPKMQAVASPAGDSRNPAVRGRIEGNAISMTMLATLLSRFERQTVIDATGLKALYALRLEWTPENAGPQTPDVLPAGPSLFAAIQEQLGLRLESRKGPVDVVVVDRAEQVPTEN